LIVQNTGSLWTKAAWIEIVMTDTRARAKPRLSQTLPKVVVGISVHL